MHNPELKLECFKVIAAKESVQPPTWKELTERTNRLYNYIMEDESKLMRQEKTTSEIPEEPLYFKDLELSVRAQVCIKALCRGLIDSDPVLDYDTLTLDYFKNVPSLRILSIPNCGRRTFDEIRMALFEHDIKLKK